MKKIIYLLIVITTVFSFEFVYANDINRIEMDIFIDEFGNAHITEKWDAYLNEGTEGYKPYYNLGESQIKDFEVYLGNKKFETLSYWDIDGSFYEKKYKAGLNKIDNGYELCFGISEYGSNTYIMNYTITNFVVSLEDADMVYWQLIPYDLSDKPENVYIKIHSDFKYEQTLDVWGYGNYGGYAYVHEDGYIELIHEGSLNSDEYMVALVKFPKGTFKNLVSIDNDFDYYLDMAEEGATAYKEKSNFVETIFYIIVPLLQIAAVSISIYFLVKPEYKYGTKKLIFSKKRININDAPYFRDIPCNKDIHKAYWVACNYKLIRRKTDFLGAILLKWLKNKNIENITVTSKILKKEEKALKLLDSTNLDEKELELFDMMKEASKDGVLEKNEFTNWCKNNYSEILNWFNKVIDDVTMQYVKEGLILEETKAFSKKYTVKDEMKNIAIEMAGLKKFLNEFSNIADREAIEVTLWEEYLMYAQIFGIAKKVAKDFRKLYPEILTEEVYNDIDFIYFISYSGVNAANTAKSRAESYSSGGGGFSSGGGGGGSFGGGGGGGGFR